MDFELAVMNAAKLILGSHITIRGCFYHLCQSTYRKLHELDDVENGMEWLKKIYQLEQKIL